MPSATELLRAHELEALRAENARLREALAYYAKPRAYGRGERSVFIDDSGVAQAALGHKLATERQEG